MEQGQRAQLETHEARCLATFSVCTIWDRGRVIEALWT